MLTWLFKSNILLIKITCFLILAQFEMNVASVFRAFLRFRVSAVSGLGVSGLQGFWGAGFQAQGILQLQGP